MTSTDTSCDRDPPYAPNHGGVTVNLPAPGAGAPAGSQQGAAATGESQASAPGVNTLLRPGSMPCNHSL